MPDATRRLLLCSCEKTMRVDARAIGEGVGCPAQGTADALCRRELDRFEEALAAGEPLLVGCTQEAPLFEELAEEAGVDVAFVNIRERAGWTESGEPTAKMTALIAESLVEVAPARLKELQSDGVCLVYGRGQAALDMALLLNRRLSVSLVLSDWEDLVLPEVMPVPLYRGRLARVTGALGGFEVTVDGYAPILPSARREATFLMPRDGAKSRCSIVLDLSGEPPPLTGWEKRDGYLRADPGDPAAVALALFKASDLVGSFEKPLYVTYDAAICAHGRSGIAGCTNCLDLCPAGAIASQGESVSIDPLVCGGCGACSAHCPTGAVSYAYPDRKGLIGRAQVLISSFLEAGGRDPVLLLHDGERGSETITVMARMGRGLPVNVLPLGLHSLGLAGHDLFAAALAAGAGRVLLLCDPAKQDDLAGLREEVALMRAILAGLGQAEERLELIEEADPEAVESLLWRLTPLPALARKTPEPIGGKRAVARSLLFALREAAAPDCGPVALSKGAPYGRIAIDPEGCTLCLACVSACPADALRDGGNERPAVFLVEQACVQCGLCAATCPEKVITLEPRLSFSATALRPEVLHEDEPFACLSCGKPFGSRGTIERISRQLAGKHWMFQSEERSRLIRMCDDCRIQHQADLSGGDPFAVGARPRVRTTEDYLEARDKQLKPEDFLTEE